MENSTKIKCLEYSVAVVFVLLLIASYLQLPPCSYFISLYCKVFNTTKYSPMLITALLTLTYALPIYVIKKKLIAKSVE